MSAIFYKDLPYGIGGSGGSGTNVIANPQGTPTDDLNSIQISDVIYRVMGSGGGSTILTGFTKPTKSLGKNGDVYIVFDGTDPSYINPNYSNFGLDLTNWTYDYSDHFEIIYKLNGQQSGNWAPFIGTSGTNNPKLYMQYNAWGNLSLINMYYNSTFSGDRTIPIDSVYDYTNYYKFVGSANDFTFYKGPSLDSIETVAAHYAFTAATGSSEETVKLFKSVGGETSTFDMNLYGIKVFNSNGDVIHDYIPIDDGLHDNVDDTDYVTSTTGHISHINEVSGVSGVYYKYEGNWVLISGGRDTYKSDLLWNYADDNSGNVLFGIYTVTLRSSIDNYDQIIIENASSSGDLVSGGNWNSTNQIVIDVNAIKNSYNPGYFSHTSFDQRSSRWYIGGTTLQKTIDNQSNTNGLVKVYGIKFGGSSGDSGSDMYRLRYYDAGGEFLYREYVRSSDDGIYTYKLDRWSDEEGGEPIPDIKSNIQSDIDLYYISLAPISRYSFAAGYSEIPYLYTYTIPKAGNYFVYVNAAAVNGSSSITCTGTELYYSTYQADSNRYTKVGIYSCDEGDTISLSMNYTNTAYQDNYIFSALILDINKTFSTATLEYSQSTIENRDSTVTTSTAGSKFAVSIADYNYSDNPANVYYTSTSTSVESEELITTTNKAQKVVYLSADLETGESLTLFSRNSSSYGTSTNLIFNLS